MRGKIRIVLFCILVCFLPACVGKKVSKFVDYDRVNTEVEDILSNEGLSRRQSLLAIRDYEAFLSAYFKTKSELKAEAMNRLADLLMTVTQNANREAKRIYENRLRLYREGQLENKPPFPHFDYSKAIALYERVLALYPSRPANDRVLYQLSHAYLEEGRKNLGVQMLNSLVNQYPKSTYFLEASFRVGDLYFDLGLFAKAHHAYQRVVTRGPGPFYEKGLYKMGWSFFKLQKYDLAVDTLRKLLDAKGIGGVNVRGSSGALKERLSDTDWDMVQDAVRVMAISFDYLGGGSALSRYFKKVGHRDYEEMVYRGLGDFYLASGKKQKAVSAYSLFLNLYPLHSRAPSLQWLIVRAFDQEQNISLATEARIQFVQKFGPDSPWAEKHKQGLEGIYSSRMKQTIYHLALFFHSEAQGLKQADAFKKAVKWYQIFLNHYPESKEAPEVHFLLAEGQLERGKFLEAAKAFETVAYEYPQHPSKKEAAYAALIAYERVKDGLPGGQAEIEDLILKSGKRFIEKFPDHEKTPDVLLKVIQLELKKENRVEARKWAELLLDHEGGSEEMRVKTYEMLGSGYIQEGNYVQAAKAYRSVLSLIPLTHPKREKFAELLGSSLYREASRMKEKGALGEASEILLQTSREIPESPLAQASLYEASLLLLKQGDSENAKRLLQELISVPSPYQEKAQKRLANLHDEEGSPLEAAKLYDQIWMKEADEQRRADLIFYTGVLYEKGREWAVAAERFQKVSSLPYVDQHRALEATFLAAQNLFRQGDHAESKKLYSAVIFMYDRASPLGEEMISFVARSHLILGTLQQERFLAIQLRHPLEQSLKRKEERMEEALNHFRGAEDFKIAEVVTEASYRTGQLFEAFAQALLSSERPQELTPSELKEYNLLLEDEAVGWKKRAVRSYEKNVRRTHAVGLYDHWVKESYDRLASLFPKMYLKYELKERLIRGHDD